MTLLDSLAAFYGVPLALYPANPLFAVEVQVAQEVAGAPDPTPANYETVGPIPGDRTAYVHRAPADGKGRWFRIRHVREGYTPSAWTGWIRGVPRSLAGMTVTQPASLRPIVNEYVTEFPVQGKLELGIIDPQVRVTLIEARTKTGAGAWTAWEPVVAQLTVWRPGETIFPVVVALYGEGSGSIIDYRVTGYDELGELRILAASSVAFNPGSVPGPPLIQGSLSQAGVLSLVFTGDSDQATLRYALSTSGYPTAATARAAGALAGRVVSVANAGTFNPGVRVYVSAFAYNTLGDESVLAQAVLDAGSAIEPPKATITSTASSRTAETVFYAGVLGLNGVGPLEFRKRVVTKDAPVDATTGWTAWSQTVPSAESVARHALHQKEAQLEVRDAGAGSIVGRVFWPIGPVLSALNDAASGLTMTATVAGVPAQDLSKAAGNSFLEPFDQLPVVGDGWLSRSGTGALAISANGRTGGKTLQVTGHRWLVPNVFVPFDASKLYRLRGRVRQVTDATNSGTQTFYLGLEGVGADGVTLVNNAGANSSGSQHYVAAAAAPMSAAAGWQEFTAYIRGHAAGNGTTSAKPNATDPAQLHANVRYIRPLFIANYSTGNGVVELDYIALDILEEGSVQASHATLDRTNLGRLTSGAADSRAAVLNAHFRYGVDSTGGVVDGTGSPLAGGARGYTAIDSGGVVNQTAIDFARGYTGKHAGNLPRVPGSAIAVSTAIGHLADTGHAAGTMQDSRAAVLNAHFRYGTDGVAGVVESSTKHFVDPVYLDTGAGNRRPTSLWDAVAVLGVGATDLNVGRRRAIGAIADEAGGFLAAAKDSRAAVLNAHFRYGTDSTAGVVDGVGSPLAGGARGFSAIDSGLILNTGSLDFARAYTGKNAGNLPRSSGSAVAVSTAIGQLADSGHAAATMQDSRAAVLNAHFRYGTDSTAGVVDGVGSPLAGGARGFVGLNTSGQVTTGLVATATLDGIRADVAREQVGAAQRGLAEDFSRSFPGRRWALMAGAPTVTTPVSATSKFGGRVLRAAGSCWYEGADNIPFDPEVLYEMRLRVRRVVAGTNPQAIYCGVAGVAADGVTRVNTTGANNYSSQHYFVSSGGNPPTVGEGGAWTDYVGYFKGHGVAPGGPRPDAHTPGTLHANVRFIRPLFVLNWTGSADAILEVDYLLLPVGASTSAMNVGEEGRRRTDTLYASDAQLLAAVQDSRAAVLNAHFRYGTDGAAGVVEDSARKFVEPSYVDANRRPVGVWDATLGAGVGANDINVGQSRARGGFSNATGGLVSTAADSRAAVLNAHFRYGTDGVAGVVESSTKHFVDPAYLDTGAGNRRPIAVWSTASGVLSSGEDLYQGKNRALGGFTNAAGALVSTAQDSRAAVLNAHFRYGTDGAAGIVESATQKFVHGDALDGSRKVRVLNTTDGGVGTAFGQRSANSAPLEYLIGTTQEFKIRTAIGAPGSATYGVLVTEKTYVDASGGSATQTFKSADGQFKREGPNNGATSASWTAWKAVFESETQRIDRASGHLLATMQDSRAAVLNAHFRYGTDGAAGVLETAGQKFIHGNALDGSRYLNFAGTGVTNRRADAIQRSAGDATALSTIVGHLANTGHAGATMQDSRGAVVNAMFRAGVDSLDSVTEGATYKRVLGVTSGKVTDTSVDGTAAFARMAGSAGASTISGGGTITWASGAVSWTQRLISIPDPISADNYFDFGPLSGIALSSWQGLYFRVQVGGTSNHANQAKGANAAGYFVAPYNTYVPAAPTSGYKDYLVAMHNGDTGNLHLFDGRVIPGGNSIQLGTGQISNIPSFATDSRGASVNAHFRYGTDGPGGVVETTAQKFIHGDQLFSGDRRIAYVAGKYAANLARGAEGVLFRETWATTPTHSAAWAHGYNSSGAVQVSDGSAQSGSYVLRCYGYNTFSTSDFLAFDPNKLYRLRIRVRQPGAATHNTLYAGLLCSDASGNATNNNSGAQYHLSNGNAIYSNYGISNWVILEVWIKGATRAYTDNGSTGAAGTALDPLAVNLGTTLIRPYILANYQDANDGNILDIDYYEIAEVDPELARRTHTGLDSSGVIRKNLPSTVGQSNGLGVRILAKGRLAGSCRHGDSVTFPTSFFSQPPMVIIAGGANTEPRSKWGATGSGSETGAVNGALPQYDDVMPLNLTAAGFSMRARLRQKSGSTARSHNFAANNLTSSGQSVSVQLANAPANNDQYTVRLDASVTANDPGGAGFLINDATLVVAIDVDAGAGWVERATRTYTAQSVGSSGNQTTSVADDYVTVTVSGLDATDYIRVRIKSLVFSEASGGSASVVAEVASYSTSSDAFATKTPDADDRVTWEALEVN